MAYDENGQWQPEDDSTASKVADLTSQDSKLMQSARTSGLQSAGSRGLLNSSMAAEASQAAAIKAAEPIAAQEAAQSHEKNLAAQNQTYQQELQAVDLDAQSERLGLELAAQQDINTQNIQANQTLLDTELAAKAADSEAQRALDERLAQMNIDQKDQDTVAASLAQFDQNYQSTVASIMENDKLKAADRDQELANAAAARDSNYALIEQIYGVDLVWDTVVAV